MNAGRKRLTAAALCALATIALSQGESACAPEKSGGETPFGRAFGPEAPCPPPFDIDWAAQDRLTAASPTVAAWVAENKGWRVVFDERTGRPWRAYGPGIPIAPKNADDATLRAAIESFAAEVSRRFGLPGDPPKLRHVARAGRLRYASFDQTFGGVRGDDAGFTLRVDLEGRVVLWGGRFLAPPPDGPAPTLLASDARVVATMRLRGDGFVLPTTKLRVVSEERVVHASIATWSGASAFAWRLRLSADAPRAEWIVYVDARTGAVLEYWNDVRSCRAAVAAKPRRSTNDPERAPSSPRPPVPLVATASGLVHLNVPPDQPGVAVPLPDCLFLVDGVPHATDASGGFVAATAASPSIVSSGLDGLYATTVRGLPPDAFFGATTSGPTLTVLFDDSNSSQAERDAYFFTTRARNQVLLRNPFETLFNAPIVVNVDLPGACNANYDGTALNFFSSAAGCVNSAYCGTIVEHEYGHHVTATIYAAHNKSVPGHLGEGFSDAQAGACEDVSIVGAGFYGPGTFVRDMNNACQWPASCGGGIHARGRVIAGAYWHTRQAFATAYGAAGKVAVDEYLYQHFHGTPMNETESCLEMLLLDDDDSDLSDGTPNLAKFYSGFATSHAVPFPIPLISIAHVPLGDTADASRPYEVRATIASVQGAAIASATLHYSVDGGPFFAQATTLVGGERIGFIPAQPGASVVAYYFSATDAFGAQSREPRGAPYQTHAFRTYRPVVFYSEDFETGGPGWTTSSTSGPDEWQIGAPNDPSHPYDPPGPFGGVSCIGTDLSLGGLNGDYANNGDVIATSPPIDCTGRTGVVLGFRRWLSVEDGLYDAAKILVSVGGGPYAAVWWNQSTPGGTGHHVDRSWSRQFVRLPAADLQANVRVRFQLVSDAGVVFGGWTLDDVTLDAIDSGPPLSVSGSLAAGTFGHLQVRGAPGEPFLLCADLATPGAYVPFVGTISVDPTSSTFIVIAPFGTTVPASGALLFTFGVPPGLSGLAVATQAAFLPLDGSPPAISNVAFLAFP
jgi:hypothetical protein